MNISQALKKRGVTIAQNIFDELKNGSQVKVDKAEAYIMDLSREITQPNQPAEQLKLIPVVKYPLYNAIHSINVTMLSMLFAYKMGYDLEDLREVGLGAMLHDMGKINTPDHLIWKQDGVDDYERTTIAEHPTFGAHWLGNANMLTERVLEIIKGHHEDYSGNGYPDGVSDRELKQTTRIVSLCNYYDYLSSTVPEKPGLAPRAACFSISKQSNKKFHPKLVSHFLSKMGPILMNGPLYQKTALVLLDTKEVAAIMKIDDYGDTHPEILVLTNSAGKKLPRPVPVNLKKDSSRKIVKIIKND